jgi:hypothetical protein
MEVRMPQPTADRSTSARFRRGLVPVIAAAAALLAVAACSSGPHDGSTARSARDAIVDGANDLGLEIGSPSSRTSAAAMGSGKHEGENVLEELASTGGGKHSASHVPGPDDWRIITNSLNLFRHPPYVTDLVLGLGSAIVVALALTATPRRAVRYDPVAAAEQRKATVICALIGCIAAELVQASEQFLLGAEIALVLFGIGGLVRFRTLFDDAGQTGVAIIATVLGLACGMSEYSLAALALVIVFLVNWWMNSVAVVLVRVKVRKHADLAQVQAATTGILQDQGFSVVRTVPNAVERTIEVHARTASDFDASSLVLAIQGVVPDARVRIKSS